MAFIVCAGSEASEVALRMARVWGTLGTGF